MAATSATRWQHHDTEPDQTLWEVGAFTTPEHWAALPRIEKPGKGSSSVRALRALAVMSAYVVEELRTQGVREPPEGQVRVLANDWRASLYPTRGHAIAAARVARTWQLIPDPGTHTYYACNTVDGLPADLVGPALRQEAETETGAWPALLIGVVAVAGIAAAAVAVIYCAQMAATVIDRKLTEEARTQRLLATQTQAIALVNQHAERERAAGRVIPWSPQEQQVLDTLNGVQRDIARQTHEPLPNPFPGAGTLERGAEKLVSTLGDIALVGAAAAGVYLMTKAS
jgi:hypothetical protein